MFGFVLSASASLAQTAGSAPAGSTATTTKPTIVTLSFNAAVLGTAEAQRELSSLQKKYSPREGRLKQLDGEIEASKRKLNDSANTLTEADKTRGLQELEVKEKQFRREAEDYKNDSDAESQQVFQQVAQKVFLFLQEFSRQQGYAAVLERGTDASPVVWYVASNVDITEQVIKEYDAKFGSGAAALPDKPGAVGSVRKRP